MLSSWVGVDSGGVVMVVVFCFRCSRGTTDRLRRGTGGFPHLPGARVRAGAIADSFSRGGPPRPTPEGRGPADVGFPFPERRRLRGGTGNGGRLVGVRVLAHGMGFYFVLKRNVEIRRVRCVQCGARAPVPGGAFRTCGERRGPPPVAARLPSRCVDRVVRSTALAFFLSLHLKQHRATYDDLLDRVRARGDWEAWVDFFLEGVERTALGAVQTARRLVALFEHDTRRVQSLGRGAANTLRVLAALRWCPVLALRQVCQTGSMNFPTAAKGMMNLVAAGIAREHTGQRRNRVFVYDADLKILNEGGEPLGIRGVCTCVKRCCRAGRAHVTFRPLDVAGTGRWDGLESSHLVRPSVTLRSCYGRWSVCGNDRCALSSVVEHFLHTEGVQGSNP